MKKSILILTLLLISFTVFAQHGNESHENTSTHGTHSVKHGKNVIVVSYGYNHIREGIAHEDFVIENEVSTEGKGHWVSSVGLDYFREVAEKWEVGVKIDFQLGHYIIPHRDNLERENAFLVLASTAYKVTPNWAFFTGIGGEFEKNENLVVFRLGTEYGIHLKHGWTLPIGFFWDIKSGYDVYAFTVGIGKHF